MAQSEALSMANKYKDTANPVQKRNAGTARGIRQSTKSTTKAREAGGKVKEKEALKSQQNASESSIVPNGRSKSANAAGKCPGSGSSSDGSSTMISQSKAREDQPLLVVHDSDGTENKRRAYRPDLVWVCGIKAYKTKAAIDEVCILYLQDRCPWWFKCDRIHPVDRSLYKRKLYDKSSAPLFFKKGGAAIPTQEQPKEEASSSSVASTSRSTSPSSSSRGQGKESTKPNVWDYDRWDDVVDVDSWFDDDSTSSEESKIKDKVSNDPTPSSQRSSDTEEEHPAPSQRSTPWTVGTKPFDEKKVCHNWLRNQCNYVPCRYLHPRQMDNTSFSDDRLQRRWVIQDYVNHAPSIVPQSTTENADPDEKSHIHKRVPSVKSEHICAKWVEGKCWRGKACPFQHPELSTAKPSSLSTHGAPVTLVERHALPPKKEICVKWLRNECKRGYACNYTHEDLDYDRSLPRRRLIPIPARNPPEVMSRLLYKHIKIKVSDGFEITQVITGFETSWVYLGNIPTVVKQEAIMRLLKEHGEVIDLRMPEKIASAYISVRARFISATEAAKVCTILNGMDALGTTLTARLSLENSSKSGVLNDTSVRVTWEAPSRTAFCGYLTQEDANQAIERCRGAKFADRILWADNHTGLPAVGRYNVRLDGVPADADIKEVKEFAKANDIMWGQPNYTEFEYSKRCIKKMVKEYGTDLLEFEIMPPPYKHGIMVGWAHFPTPSEAKGLCDGLHGRKPKFTGYTRISARHVQTLEYTLTHDLFDRAQQELHGLKETAWRIGHLSVTFRHRPTFVSVRLSGEDVKELSQLKAELDVVLSGEVVRDNGKVAWDPFFCDPRGLAFVGALQREHPKVVVSIDKCRRSIRLFGPLTQRLVVRGKIIDKVQELNKLTVRVVRLDGRLIGLFIKDELPALIDTIGQDNLFLNISQQTLSIRGDPHTKDQVLDALTRTGRKYRSDRPRVAVECPVCFDEVSAPVTLCCGHSWCKTCLIRYLKTAIDQRFFPLTCLGNGAKCPEKIPLSCASQLLHSGEFETLIETAFATYIQRNPTEFAYCPTPDCQQVYRPVARVEVPAQLPAKKNTIGTTSSKNANSSVSIGTILQCPSCLVRICASCQTEAHDGLLCVRPDEGKGLFEEWMKNNNVKPCPGCKMPIEKVMGCHHMTCAVCATHLCWICLMPFPNGSGVYSHMLSMHGSFV